MRHRRALLMTLLATWALALGTIGIGTERPPDARDMWPLLVQTGDSLARVGGTQTLEAVGPVPLTARTAYLLAFHHAQDALDVPRMLAVATRLERLGEDGLAAHVRRAARATAESALIPTPPP